MPASPVKVLPLLLLLLVVTATAIPQGFSAFFDSATCPDGWGELNVAQGRLIVSTASPTHAGITVGTPLGDQEDRKHTHAFTTSINVPQKDISAIGCCNNQGAHHGQYQVANLTQATDSAYPFTQLLLCTFQGHNDTDPVAYGSIGYFDPDIGGCPAGWGAMRESEGRLLVPSYEQGGAIPNAAPPLASGEDRTHNHTFSIQFPVTDVSYAGAEGCCDSGTADFGNGQLTVAAAAQPASTGLPYVQLLTCVAQVPTFNQTLPDNALVFSSVSCPPGWSVVDDVSGRLLVALPGDGQPGASFGGNSLTPDGKTNPAHSHVVAGSLTLPTAGVGLASGCCGSGYIGAGTYGYQGTTSDVSDMLPYTLLPLCRSTSGARGAKPKIGAMSSRLAQE